MTFRPLLAGAAFASALAASSVALAQEPNDIGGYRSHRTYESPQHWAVELRFGPYRPNIDEDFSGAKPYETAFGDDHRLYFGVEVDWQAIRIPHFGSLGPGASWGYTHMSANARLSSTGEPSAENTSLWIMPMYGVGVLRIDVLARDMGIPFVFYGKAGVGYALWSSSNDLGTSKVDGVVGKGHTWGTHFAFGGMLLLDNFDQGSANQLDNETGINNTYVFFEWMQSKLDGFGASDHSALHVGTNTWVLGLAFEL